MIELKSKSKTEKKALDAGSTRARLDALLNKAFDPEVIGEHRLHPVETARFIADQARKLRLAAMRSGHTGLVWMIESVYYEAYTMGCARQGLEVEPAGTKRN
ncbi:hypothetical protein [Aestuariivirga sp.]|uniref:hypothetical protein n=1 Tax=Aestuariivirga sp. TaxID=2650926 RepID=UPI003BAABBCA